MELELIAKFTGDEADEHRLPAYEGAQSLHGIARGLVLVSHYLSTGTIRHRSPFSDNVRVFMAPPQRGSVETIFQLVSDQGLLSLGGALGIAVSANLMTDFIKRVFRRAVGRDTSSPRDPSQAIEDARPGDVDALVDSVEPAIKLAHTSIDNGAGNIVIITGDNNVVNFDRRSKQYVQQSIHAEFEERLDVSVGSLNANSNYGRVFVHELGKTVPFIIARDAARGTKSVMARSLDLYANDLPSNISILFRRITAVDGRTKMFIIYSADEVAEAPERIA